MANDRGIFTSVRRMVDRFAGKDMAHTLVYRIPELRFLRAEHFDEDLNLVDARRLFSAAVRLIEIETHSYCNRVCWFCPNAHIDRRTERHYLPESTFLQALSDLRSIGYRQQISFSRYNEPFGDDVIFERLAQTRRFLPKAHVVAFSNGDFLNPERIDRIQALGVDQLNIGIYIPNGQDWSTDKAESLLQKAAARLALVVSRRREAPAERISYAANVAAMSITLFSPNYATNGVTRGGSVSGVPLPVVARVSPCLYPITDVYIDFDGHIMPCCHLRSDEPLHRDCALGQIDHSVGSLFSVWGGAVAARWRKSLCQFSTKLGPCANCTARIWSDSPTTRRVINFARNHALPMRKGMAVANRRDAPSTTQRATSPV